MRAKTVAGDVTANGEVGPSGRLQQPRNVHQHVSLLVGEQDVQDVEANDGVERTWWQVRYVVRVVAVRIIAPRLQEPHILPEATAVVESAPLQQPTFVKHPNGQ